MQYGNKIWLNCQFTCFLMNDNEQVVWHHPWVPYWLGKYLKKIHLNGEGSGVVGQLWDNAKLVK